jgi:hypothetical protein
LTQVDRIRIGAQALRDFLLANPTVAAFGYAGHPSAPVRTFQGIAQINPDGIVGPQTRQAARVVGVTLPERPTTTTAAPATPRAAAPAPAAAPAIPVATAPTPATSPAAVLPAGYNPELARQLASQSARNLIQMQQQGRLYSYNRDLLRRFQIAAGINADGLYGGGSRGALLYYGAPSNIPRPAFRPTETQPYTPPGGAALRV